MAGQTVFSTFDMLDEIFMEKQISKHHGFLYEIITKYSDVMIDIEDEEFIIKQKENPFINFLIKRPTKNTYPLRQGFFANVDNEDLSLYPRDIFLLDKDDEFCKNAMDRFGVIVINSNSLEKIQTLSKKYQKSFDKGEEYTVHKEGKKLQGWSAFTSNFNLAPLNSIVLIDNYIFNNINSGKENLLQLFGSLLPNTLESAFHILIVIENKDAKHSLNSLTPVHKYIEEELNKLVEYQVELCIVSHVYSEEFHNRILLTNYHLIKAQYGFDMFRNSKVNRTDEPEFLSVYRTIDENEGDPEIKTAEKKLRLVQKLIKKINPETDLIIGNCFTGGSKINERKIRHTLIANS